MQVLLCSNKYICSMTEKLKALYSKFQNDFNRLESEFKDLAIYGPFLMSPKKEYLDAKRKLLIVGQETNGWGKSTNIGTQMDAYENFELGRNYNSPFWSITRKIENTIGIEKCSCAWTNINKYDENQGKPKGKFLSEIQHVNSMLTSEMEILKPDVCIFFVGPSYHHKIKEMFNGVKFESVEGWTRNALSKLVHTSLPSETYVTYHPKYLRIRKFESDFVNYFSTI